MMKRWAVLLDRDGTLVPNVHYPTLPQQLQFYASTKPALQALAAAGARFAVVSNQAAVARGMLTQEGLVRLDQRLHGLFRDAGVSLTGAFYCPHHPDFNGSCRCRKPNTGMLEDALRLLKSPPENAYLIGDTEADMEAGKRLGLRTVLVLTGSGRRSRRSVLKKRLADKVAANLEGAAAWILQSREEKD